MPRPKKQVVKETPLATPIPEAAQHDALTRADYFAISASTEGWLTEAEANLLWNTAEQAWHEHAQWVEDGSFKGKSTVLLGGVLALHGAGWLQAVDPHLGELSYPSRVENGMMDGDTTNVGSSLEAFQDTIRRAELESWVSTVQRKFTDHVPPNPVDLVFIDGLHEYSSVLADWNHIKAFLTPNATVLFHDYTTWAGPHQVVTDMVAIGELEIVAQADSLAVCKFWGIKS